MSDPAPTKLGELVRPAEFALHQFLTHDGLKPEQWFMRLSVNGVPRPWEMLTADSAANDEMIKQRILLSDKPVTELAVAFAGMVEWKGNKRPMVYLQFYRAGYEHGLLCLRHLKDGPMPGSVEAFGGLFLAGSCKNIWL